MAAFSQWHAKPGPRRELDCPVAFVLSRVPYPQPTSGQPPTILREFRD